VKLTAKAEAVLTGYPWPGNTRELQNVVQRCLALFYGQTIDEDRLHTVLSPRGGVVEAPVLDLKAADAEPTGGISKTANRRRSRQPLTSEEIQAALTAAGGSVGKAAEALGVHRSTLWRYLSPR